MADAEETPRGAATWETSRHERRPGRSCGSVRGKVRRHNGFCVSMAFSRHCWEPLSWTQNCIRTGLYPTYWFTPLSRVLLEKITSSQVLKEFALYGTRRFITAITSARHLFLFWAILIQAIAPYHTSRSILILSSKLSLGFQSGFFSSCFPTKTIYTPPLSPIRATCTVHNIPLDFITHIIFSEKYRSLSSSLRTFLHSRSTSSLLCTNTLLCTPLSNTLSLPSSPKWATKFHTHTKRQAQLWCNACYICFCIW